MVPVCPSARKQQNEIRASQITLRVRKKLVAKFSTPSYLSKSEHLAWSFLEDDGHLSQVGGALPEQMLLRAAGWSAERQLSSTLLRPVLHLVAWRIRQSDVSTTSLRADVDLKCSAVSDISPVGTIGGHQGLCSAA